MNWWFNKCRRWEQDISLLAVGALSPAERADVEAHLAECPVCRARFEELKALARRCEQIGHALPQVEPSPALRQRWMTAVRQTERQQPHPTPDWLTLWLSGRRAALGGLTAIWALVLFLRLFAPDASRPASLAATLPVSLREVLLALKEDQPETVFRGPARDSLHDKPAPPRRRPPDAQATFNLETV